MHRAGFCGQISACSSPEAQPGHDKARLLLRAGTRNAVATQTMFHVKHGFGFSKPGDYVINLFHCPGREGRKQSQG